MASSAELYNTLQSIQGQLDPLLSGQGQAPQYFKDKINTAFGNNAPLLKEGASLEAGAYTLPQKLMEQYMQDYGGTFGGPSGMARISSILGNIGNQQGLVKVAAGLADQQGANINDIVQNLVQGYGLDIQGLQQKYQNQLPLYQSAVGTEENQKNRDAQAAAANAGANQSLAFQKFLTDVQNKPDTTTANPFANAPAGAIGQRADGSYIFKTPTITQNSIQSSINSGALKTLPNQYGITPGQMQSPRR